MAKFACFFDLIRLKFKAKLSTFPQIKMLLQFAPAKFATIKMKTLFHQQRMSENLEACTPISTIIRQCYNNHRISHIFVYLRKLPLQFTSCTHTHTHNNGLAWIAAAPPAEIMHVLIWPVAGNK